MIKYLENDIIWIKPWEQYKSKEISESEGFIELLHNLPVDEPKEEFKEIADNLFHDEL